MPDASELGKREPPDDGLLRSTVAQMGEDPLAQPGPLSEVAGMARTLPSAVGGGPNGWIRGRWDSALCVG